MYFIEFLAFLLSAQSQVRAAQPVDLSNMNSVKSALQSMAANLMNYEKQGKVKAVEGNGPEGFQWFEGGMYYGIMMDYAKITQDSQYSTAIFKSLTADSFGTTGSFLGPNSESAEFGGKWNDDILWWSMPALTGAELYGKDTIMPGGVSYFNLADKTYRQAMDQWDNICAGGIYWMRSKNKLGKNQYGQSYAYKSTITQSEAIVNAVQLGILSGNQTYFSEADKIYKWMVSSGLISSSFEVFDGIDADSGKCTLSKLQLSYQSGLASGALAWLSYGTKNPAYISTAHSIFKRGIKHFTKDNIVFDYCEQEGPKCADNMAPHKGVMVRGWGMLYEFTTDAAMRTQIKQILQTTVSQMLKTCDAQWNCGQDWLGGTPATGPNIHFQMNAVELMNAYYKTFISGPVGNGLSAPTQSVVANQPPPATKSVVADQLPHSPPVNTSPVSAPSNSVLANPPPSSNSVLANPPPPSVPAVNVQSGKKCVSRRKKSKCAARKALKKSQCAVPHSPYHGYK